MRIAPRERLSLRFLKFLPVFLFPLAATACGGRGSSTTSPTTVAIDFGNNIRTRVTAIGDSITSGVQGLTPGPPYPSILQQMLRSVNPQAQVINRGVGGQRTDAGLGTADSALASDHPGFMTIMEGTNDVRQFVPLNQAAANLRQMVSDAKANKTVPILATIPREVGAASFFESDVETLNVMIRQVASQENITLADVFAALPDETYFVDDGFHPSAKGSQAIAAAFDSALLRAGYPMGQFANRAR